MWKEKQIGEFVYGMSAMHPDKVLDHGSAMISQVLAPALAARAAMAFVAKDDSQKMAVQMLASTTAILQNMNHPVIKSVIADVIAVSTIDARPMKSEWAAHFLARTGVMVEFLAWGIEGQFRDFFVSMTSALEEAAKALGARLEAVAAKQASMNESSGAPSPSTA